MVFEGLSVSTFLEPRSHPNGPCVIADKTFLGECFLVRKGLGHICLLLNSWRVDHNQRRLAED